MELATTPVDVTYTHKCSLCDSEETETWLIAVHTAVPRTGLPTGWRMFTDNATGSYLICHKHEIIVKSDGEDVIVSEGQGDG